MTVIILLFFMIAYAVFCVVMLVQGITGLIGGRENEGTSYARARRSPRQVKKGGLPL